MSRLKKVLLGITVFLALITVAIWWLLSTDSGTRFLFARASGYLPSALSVGEISGSLRGGLLASDVRWEQPGTSVSIRSLFVDISLRELVNERIAIEALELDSVSVVTRPVEQTEPSEPTPIDIELPVGIELRQSSFRDLALDINGFERRINAIGIKARMQGADLNIREIAFDSSWLDFAGRGSIRLKDSLPMRAVLDWQYYEVADWPLAGKLEVGGTVSEFALDHELQQPFEVITSGDVALAAEAVRIELENRWSRIELDDYGVATRDGSLNLSGTPDALDVVLDAYVTYRDIPEARLQANSRVTPTTAEALELSARNDWGSATIDGNLNWANNLLLELNYALEDVDAEQLYPDISGRLAASGRVAGEIGETVRQLDVGIASLQGTLNTYPVDASGSLAIDGEVLNLSALNAAIGPNTIAASGRFADTVRLDLNLTASRLDAFLPDLGGSATATLSVTGDTRNPSVELAATTSDFSYQQTRIDELSVDASGTREAHAVRIQSRAFDSNLDTSVRGKLLESGWSGSIADFTVRNPQAGAWSLADPSQLEFIDGAVSLSEFCLNRDAGPGSACARLATSDDVTFAVNIDDIPVAALPIVLPQEVTAEGRIFVRSEGRSVGGTITATASADVRDARITSRLEGETWVTNLESVTATANVAQNALESELRIATPDGGLFVTLDVEDVRSPASPIAGQARLDLPALERLAGLAPAITNPTGSASGDLVIRGTREAPEITGEIEVSDGAFGVRAAGIRVTELNARVAQQEPGSLTIRASAVSGDGPINLDGKTRMLENGGLESAFKLTGERFELVRTPDWQVYASPDVNVSVNSDATTVTGTLEIPEADVKLKDLPASAVRSSPDAVVHRSGEAAPTTQQPINIDLRAVLGEAVGLSAFGLTTNLAGSLQLRGDARRVISGFGRVSLVDGRYKAYGQDLKIQRGELIFNGPLSRPSLDVRAVREAPDVTAGIMVRGTPDALRSEVFSEPPLRDIEALSYLLTGRPLDRDSENDDFLGEAAFALGLTGAGKIASRVRSNLGLDTLTIQGGSENGTIVAGKRINERLLVEYGYGIVDQIGSLLLRYQLNERLVLESRTGVNSNLDLVYRVRKQ